MPGPRSMRFPEELEARVSAKASANGSKFSAEAFRLIGVGLEFDGVSPVKPAAKAQKKSTAPPADLPISSSWVSERQRKLNEAKERNLRARRGT